MAPKPKAKGKSSTPAMPARPGMKLRPDRALNPGTPDMPKKMRTTLEVQKAKDAKDAEKRQADEKRREGITNAAAIENKIAQEDSVQLKKILRPRIEKPAPAANNEDPIVAGAQGVVDPCSDGPGSSDEYQPAPVDKQASESDDELMDVSEGKARNPPKPQAEPRKPQGESPSRGGYGASQAGGKYKPSKKSKKANIGGIRVDWDRGRTPAVESSAPAALDRPVPASCRSSAIGARLQATLICPREVIPAASGVSHPTPTMETRLRTQLQRLTRRSPEQSSPQPHLLDAEEGRRQAHRHSRRHPPQFRTKFTPALLEYTGSIQGWNDPTAVEVVTIWNSVFTDHAVSVEKREDRDLVLVITKLAQDKIDGWRNRIGAAGVTVWKTVFKGKSKQEVIADVEWYLSGSDRSRVFYYRDVIEDEETGKTKLMGLFQSFVFSHVFTVHCNATATDGHLGPLGYPMTVPEGALTLTCHAIKRGLNYHRTGQLVIPEGSLGQFSKTNWADHMDFSEGVQKVVASTSAITTVVKKLKESQWDKIITAARAAASERADISKATVIDVDADPEESDFELVDDLVIVRQSHLSPQRFGVAIFDDILQLVAPLAGLSDKSHCFSSSSDRTGLPCVAYCPHHDFRLIGILSFGCRLCLRVGVCWIHVLFLHHFYHSLGAQVNDVRKTTNVSLLIVKGENMDILQKKLEVEQERGVVGGIVKGEMPP
ncbi:hypothetical protein B0H10DRAFT_2201008 [Mycena sp. CBHHK59/15]|nr:hypothetical protein B0H10DRAFT_2201008 [Mycena sp. CBHHK59/15]